MVNVNAEPVIWDGRLLGAPNNVYYDLVNVEPVRPPYAWRKRPTGFSLAKRKWYRRDNDFNNVVWEGWIVTDKITIKDTDGLSYNFFYALDKNSNRFKVICQPVGECGCYFEVWDDFRDEDGYDKFIVLDYVKGNPVEVVTTWSDVTTWEISNFVNGDFSGATPVEYRIEPWAWQTINYSALTTREDDKVQIGDYVYLYESSLDVGSAFPWQVRRVTGYDSANDFLRVDQWWLWITWLQETADDATFRVFKEWWQVFMFHTSGGVSIWHTNNLEEISDCNYDIDPVFTEDIPTPVAPGSRLISAQEHDNRFVGLVDTGFGFFGGTGIDKLFFTPSRTMEPGIGIHTLVSYRDFLVGFWDKRITATTIEWDVARTFELRDDIGIWWSNAHDTYDNSLYVLTSDRRLHAVSIINDWDGFKLKLDDISQFIRGELDLLKDTDEVSIEADGRYLRIFINSKNDELDDENDNTKILIFDRDYQLWYKHEVCCWVIATGSWNVFLWDWVYYYCGYRDCYNGDWVDECQTCGDHFDCWVTAYIWENEDNGTNLNTFVKKKLNWLKIMLGRWIYTDLSTEIEVIYHRNWYRYKHLINEVEYIDWINSHNQIFSWSSISEPECIDNTLPDNTIVNPDVVSDYSRQTLRESPVNPCICEDVDDLFNNHCIEVQDDGHFLEPFYNLYVPYDNIDEADLIEVTIRSKGWDRMVFGWMFAEMSPYELWHHSADWDDTVRTECD